MAFINEILKIQIDLHSRVIFNAENACTEIQLFAFDSWVQRSADL
jgi:hypothetical protein